MRCVFLALFVGVFISGISVASRKHLIDTRPLVGAMDRQEPESHILVTEIAFEQTSWNIHRFLPIFTLGPRYNKYINEHPDAASPDQYGNYYYTSTPPLTFVLPYVAAKLTVGRPTLRALRWYNIFLQVASSAAMGTLVFLCVAKSGRDLRLAALAGTTAAVIYMTAPECLKSHTITLWAQQFYALLLMIQLICFLFFPSRVLLFLLAFVGSLSDWTPYIANMAMTGVALYSYWRTRNRRALSIAAAILAGTVAGGLCMIAWFGAVIPIKSYFHNLILRGNARGLFFYFAERGIFSLPRFVYFVPRYIDSFGLFGVVGLFVLFLRLLSPNSKELPTTDRIILPKLNPLVISLFVTAASLFENIAMSDHAIPYSYDRLKGVQFLALFIAWGASRNCRVSAVVYGLSALAGLISICLFLFAYDTPRGWNFIAHSQEERVGTLIRETASTSGPAFFNGEIRGSEIYYAGRNIFEAVNRAAESQNVDLVTFVAQWCREKRFDHGTLYEISGFRYELGRSPDPEELPRSVRIRRVFSDGRVIELGTVRLAERASDYHPQNKDWGGFDPLWK